MGLSKGLIRFLDNHYFKYFNNLNIELKKVIKKQRIKKEVIFDA